MSECTVKFRFIIIVIIIIIIIICLLQYATWRYIKVKQMNQVCLRRWWDWEIKFPHRSWRNADHSTTTARKTPTNKWINHRQNFYYGINNVNYCWVHNDAEIISRLCESDMNVRIRLGEQERLEARSESPEWRFFHARFLQHSNYNAFERHWIWK